MAPQPTLEVVPVTGQAVNRGDRGMHRLSSDFRGQLAVLHRHRQLVYVDQSHVTTRPHDEVEIVVLGRPHVSEPGEPTDVEVVVLVALVAGVEVEDRGA